MSILDNMFPPETKLTPKQKTLLSDPRLSDLITKLDLQVQPSEEHRTNTAITARIDQWLADLQKQPAKPRYISTLQMTQSEPIVQPRACNEATGRTPFDLDPAFIADLIATNGPKSSWKYPLKWCPF